METLNPAAASTPSGPKSFLRALLVGAACFWVAGAWAAQAAAFPLMITALASGAQCRTNVVHAVKQLASHSISAGGAALLCLLQPGEAVSWPGTTDPKLVAGCILLLVIQFTRLRHPPALASGGGVLCGLDPVAVVSCVAVTGSILLFEPFLERIRRVRL